MDGDEDETVSTGVVEREGERQELRPPEEGLEAGVRDDGVTEETGAIEREMEKVCMTRMDSIKSGSAFECAICLAGLQDAATGSCFHHFCAPCLLQWASSSAGWPECPVCRTRIHQIKLDPEFDALLQRIDAPAPAAASRLAQYTVVVDLTPGAFAGITLRDAKNEDVPRPGVKVSRLVKRDAGYKAGLRVGDVIVCMNGMPVLTHKECIEMVEAATRARTTLTCLLLPRDRRARISSVVQQPPPAARRDVVEEAEQSNTQLPSLVFFEEAATMSHVEIDNVVYYQIRCTDGQASWTVSQRYSKWREMYETVCQRWPGQWLDGLAFPCKSYSFRKPTDAFCSRRAADLEVFIRALLLRCETGDGVDSRSRWLHHWLRASI